MVVKANLGAMAKSTTRSGTGKNLSRRKADAGRVKRKYTRRFTPDVIAPIPAVASNGLTSEQREMRMLMMNGGKALTVCMPKDHFGNFFVLSRQCTVRFEQAGLKASIEGIIVGITDTQVQINFPGGDEPVWVDHKLVTVAPFH